MVEVLVGGVVVMVGGPAVAWRGGHDMVGLKTAKTILAPNTHFREAYSH
jgi:hypothetical protein